MQPRGRPRGISRDPLPPKTKSLRNRYTFLPRQANYEIERAMAILATYVLQENPLRLHQHTWLQGLPLHARFHRLPARHRNSSGFLTDSVFGGTQTSRISREVASTHLGCTKATTRATCQISLDLPRGCIRTPRLHEGHFTMDFVDFRDFAYRLHLLWLHSHGGG